MADGDVVLDRTFVLEEPSGTHVSLFACEDSDRPGGYKYSFQHYDPDTCRTLLRYDNAHEHPVAGWHHRHCEAASRNRSTSRGWIHICVGSAGR
jgi:hypothetical protein